MAKNGGRGRRLINRFLQYMAPGILWDDDQRNLVADGLVGNIAGTFVNPFMTPYALSFGATKLHISILNALPGLFGNLVQVPASYVVESTGKRKSLIVTSGVVTRIAWLFVILLPLFTRGIWGVYALTGLMVLIAVAGSVVTPAWTSLVSDLIPRKVRGRFFSTRNIIMSLGALLTVNLAGQVVTRGGFPTGYVLSMAIFWVLSWASLYFFTKVRDVPFSPSRTETRRLLRIDTEALRDPLFAPWIKVVSYFNIGVGLVGSLFGAYLIQDLNGTPAHLATMSFAATLTGIFGQRFWGPVADRKGPKFAAVTSVCLSSLTPIFWYLAKNPLGAIAAETFSGMAWSGWGLGTFNLILDITPEAKRPSYVATANLIGGVTAFFAPLVGGFLATRYTLRPVMLIAAVGRASSGYFLHKYVKTRDEIEHAKS